MITTRNTVVLESRNALDTPIIAELFRHYVDFLAPWYDLNDSQNTFGTIVPIHSLECPVLFRALIAFAASHCNRISGRFPGIGAIYHAECVRGLLHAIDDIKPE